MYGLWGEPWYRFTDLFGWTCHACGKVNGDGESRQRARGGRESKQECKLDWED